MLDVWEYLELYGECGNDDLSLAWTDHDEIEEWLPCQPYLSCAEQQLIKYREYMSCLQYQ